MSAQTPHRTISSPLGKRAQDLLVQLVAAERRRALGIADPSHLGREHPVTMSPAPVRELIGAGFIRRTGAVIAVTAEGAAWVARCHAAARAAHIDPFAAQHLAIATRDIDGPDGIQSVAVNDSESPLAWLARRKDRDGLPLIAVHQLTAGERLRSEFTYAHMTPRVTANWQAAVTQSARAHRDGFAPAFTETVIAARQRVHAALESVGPEFSGLLLDVCCFLKGLDDVERERRWPARSAKVVLLLGLDRLARHYGLGAAAHGKARSAMRAWSETAEAGRSE